ncbi:MAG: DNA polymerase IV, partial [Mycobacterium sp.]
EVSGTHLPPTLTEVTATPPAWRIGDDVAHTTYGHGWIQGAGHGVMTVRFETRSTGPGPVHTLRENDPDIVRTNPVDSLDWPDYVEELSRYQSSP